MEAIVAIRMDLQGQVVDRDISAGGLWILVDNTTRLGGDHDSSCWMDT